MPPTYKLKQCKQFIETGTCSYGNRCQFIHNCLSVDKQKDSSYSRMLRENCGFIAVRMNCLSEEHMMYVPSYERRRLNVFSKLAESINITKEC